MTFQHKLNHNHFFIFMQMFMLLISGCKKVQGELAPYTPPDTLKVISLEIQRASTKLASINDGVPESGVEYFRCIGTFNDPNSTTADFTEKCSWSVQGGAMIRSTNGFSRFVQVTTARGHNIPATNAELTAVLDPTVPQIQGLPAANKTIFTAITGTTYLGPEYYSTTPGVLTINSSTDADFSWRAAFSVNGVKSYKSLPRPWRAHAAIRVQGYKSITPPEEQATQGCGAISVTLNELDDNSSPYSPPRQLVNHQLSAEGSLQIPLTDDQWLLTSIQIDDLKTNKFRFSWTGTKDLTGECNYLNISVFTSAPGMDSDYITAIGVGYFIQLGS